MDIVYHDALHVRYAKQKCGACCMQCVGWENKDAHVMSPCLRRLDKKTCW